MSERRIRRAFARRLPLRFNSIEEALGISALILAILIALAQVALADHVKTVKSGTIEVGDPWSRATPGGAKVAGGYLTIHNTGGEPDRLLSANTEIAGHTEVHEMSMDNGVMTMRPLPNGLDVPAHGEVALEPGSYHLMFMDLKQPLKEGEVFPGTLVFERAGSMAVEFKVLGIGEKAHDHGSHSTGN